MRYDITTAAPIPQNSSEVQLFEKWLYIHYSYHILIGFDF